MRSSCRLERGLPLLSDRPVHQLAAEVASATRARRWCALTSSRVVVSSSVGSGMSSKTRLHSAAVAFQSRKCRWQSDSLSRHETCITTLASGSSNANLADSAKLVAAAAVSPDCSNFAPRVLASSAALPICRFQRWRGYCRAGDSRRVPPPFFVRHLLISDFRCEFARIPLGN